MRLNETGTLRATQIHHTEMWLVYQADDGLYHYQPWQDVEEIGSLIDPTTGNTMELVGWTTEDPD